MTEFTPPISSRNTEDLIAIAHSSEEEWSVEAQTQAKNELGNRNISEEKQKSIVNKWEKEHNKFLLEESIRLEENSKESYTWWEMVIIYLFGPIIFFAPIIHFGDIVHLFFNNETFSELKENNYKKKVLQRLIILILSFVTWYIILNNYHPEPRPLKDI